MLNRRECIYGMGAAAALSALTSCGESTDTAVLNIAVFSQAVDYGPLYVADNFEWLRGPDIQASIHEHPTAPSFTTALGNGTADVVFAAEPPIILARGAGVDVKIVGVSCTLRQEIVVRSALNISSIADLAGRRVAVLQGTSSHYGLLSAFRQAQVQPGPIAFMTPPQAEAAFRAGQIDAWAVWPPFVEKLQLEQLGTVLAGGDAIIQSVYAATAAALNQKAAAITALRNAIDRAKAWMSRHPQEAQLIIADRLNMDRRIIELAWSKHDWSAQINPSLRDDIANKVRFLRGEQLLATDWSEDDLSNLFAPGAR